MKREEEVDEFDDFEESVSKIRSKREYYDELTGNQETATTSQKGAKEKRKQSIQHLPFLLFRTRRLLRYTGRRHAEEASSAEPPPRLCQSPRPPGLICTYHSLPPLCPFPRVVVKLYFCLKINEYSGSE